ncbi:hypothetical protein ABVK25_001034 [Lepraria finkii]|uniref:Uncharacterized protein n=1 Tax=Lepraria finkii TaxID=1340010 RepID=A0ABR4BKU3_9LECA
MLCLWLLCKDALFKTPRRPSPILKEWDGADLFTQHTEAIPGRPFLEALNAKDQMPILAHELLTLTAGLGQERKSKLSRLFLLCLASEPTDRSSDSVELLELLSQARLTPLPITDIGQGEVYLPPPFQIAKSFTSLMDRVRKHIFCCLKLQATSYRCKACHDSAAFQVALCYKVGFGISSSEDQVRYWLGDERTLEDLERELEIVRNADWSHTDTITKLLDEGYYIQMDYSGEYQRAGILEASVAEYVREMRDMERVLGRLHPVIRRLNQSWRDVIFRKTKLSVPRSCVGRSKCSWKMILSMATKTF